MCRGSPGRYRTGRGSRLSAEVVVEVGSGPWWFTLALAATIAIRLGVVLYGYVKRGRGDRENP